MVQMVSCQPGMYGGGQAPPRGSSGNPYASLLPYPTNLYPTPQPFTCSQRDRCARRPQDFPFHAVNCFCDDLCLTYNDCCKDFTPSSISYKKIKLAKNTVSCERRHQIYQDGEIYIVKSCPRDYEDAFVKEKCEDERAEDQFYQLPVTGITTGVLYRNVFCAICAGDRNVTFWTVKIECEAGPSNSWKTEGEISHDNSKSLIQSSLDSSAQNCLIRYEHPPDLPFRKCKSHFNKCDKNFHGDRKIEKKCKSYTSFVYASLHVFKNKHCGICNHVNETYLSCEDMRTPIPPFMGEQGPEGIPHFVAPYSILLDVNNGQGMISENRVGAGGVSSMTESQVQIRSCPEGHVHNPFQGTCILVYCPKGSKFSGGVCSGRGSSANGPTTEPYDDFSTWADDDVTSALDEDTYTPSHLMPLHKSSTTSISVSSTTTIPKRVEIPKAYDSQPHGPSYNDDMGTMNCPVMKLNASDFSYLTNGSIHVNFMSRLYHPGEYTSAGHNLFICLPFTEQTYNVTTNATSVEMFKFSMIQSLVSLIGIVISLTALLVLFVVYMALPPLRNLPGKCLISLVMSLFTAQCLFLFGTARTEIPILCVALAALMHFCFLAAFLWVNVLAIDICRTFSGSAASGASRSASDGANKRFAVYSFYAWMIPALIVGGSLALDLFEVHELYRPHYGERLCWISSRRALLVLFALPMAILLFVNILLFTVTIVHICIIDRQTKKAMQNSFTQSAPNSMQKEKNRFILYIKLSFIMGLTWIFGFLATLTEHHVLWYVFIVFNTLQGAFLCLAFVCTKKVFRLLRKKHGSDKNKAANSTRYTNTYTTSSNTRVGYTRPSYLFDGEARIVAQETSI